MHCCLLFESLLADAATPVSRARQGAFDQTLSIDVVHETFGVLIISASFLSAQSVEGAA
jgi:hypothetical protein